MLWKQRNARAFGNLQKQLNPAQTIERITGEFKLWESARGGERTIMPQE
jgi:hypothetical protein